MNLILRAMLSTDIRAVADLAEEAFRDSYPFDWTANAKALYSGAESGRVYVGIADLDGRVAGYCNLRAWPGGGWIDQIVVAKREQRKGIGRKLLGHILDEAVRRQFWKASLIASEAEPELLAFYTSFGFEKEGVLKDQIKKGINGLLLSYIIDYNLHPNR